MAGRRALRPIKKPVFLAGEGLSERGYGRWLNRLANQQNLPIAIRSERLQGGDPLDLVQQALVLLRGIERHRGAYPIRGLLLDRDRLGQSQERDRNAIRLAHESSIRFIWQEPAHEAFLLRHFRGYQHHRPPDNAAAERLLAKVWPAYSKGMGADRYGSILAVDHLNVARSVEPELDTFLRDAGWPRSARQSLD